MKSNFSSVGQSYEMAGQAPLDSKMMTNTLEELRELGNNKAFSCHRGMMVFCHETNKWYIWTDVFKEGEEKVLYFDYQYPDGSIYAGIDYSKKKFNFIPFVNKGHKGDKGDQGIQGIQGLKGDKGDKGDKGQPGFAIVSAGISVPGGNEKVLKAIIPFTKKQLQDNDWKLNHSLNIKRILTEFISYPTSKYGEDGKYASGTPLELSNIEGLFSLYSVSDKNNIKLQDFHWEDENEVFYYIIEYIAMEELIFKASADGSVVTLNLSNEQRTTSLATSLLKAGASNSYSNEITSFKITSLGLATDGAFNNVVLNTLYSFDSLPNLVYQYADGREKDSFISEFTYVLVDNQGYESTPGVIRVVKDSGCHNPQIISITQEGNRLKFVIDKGIYKDGNKNAYSVFYWTTNPAQKEKLADVNVDTSTGSRFEFSVGASKLNSLDIGSGIIFQIETSEQVSQCSVVKSYSKQFNGWVKNYNDLDLSNNKLSFSRTQELTSKKGVVFESPLFILNGSFESPRYTKTLERRYNNGQWEAQPISENGLSPKGGLYEYRVLVVDNENYSRGYTNIIRLDNTIQIVWSDTKTSEDRSGHEDTTLANIADDYTANNFNWFYKDSDYSLGQEGEWIVSSGAANQRDFGVNFLNEYGDIRKGDQEIKVIIQSPDGSTIESNVLKYQNLPGSGCKIYDVEVINVNREATFTYKDCDGISRTVKLIKGRDTDGKIQICSGGISAQNGVRLTKTRRICSQSNENDLFVPDIKFEDGTYEKNVERLDALQVYTLVNVSKYKFSQIQKVRTIVKDRNSNNFIEQSYYKKDPLFGTTFVTAELPEEPAFNVQIDKYRNSDIYFEVTYSNGITVTTNTIKFNVTGNQTSNPSPQDPSTGTGGGTQTYPAGSYRVSGTGTASYVNKQGQTLQIELPYTERIENPYDSWDDYRGTWMRGYDEEITEVVVCLTSVASNNGLTFTRLGNC